MRSLIAALAATLLLAAPVSAVEKEFTGAWDWYGDEADIQGFRIKDGNNNVVVDTDQIPPAARQGSGIVQVPQNGCITLFVVAVDLEGEESGNSNILPWCLPKKKTVAVEAFQFTITE